jgi:hypothetical protein
MDEAGTYSVAGARVITHAGMTQDREQKKERRQIHMHSEGLDTTCRRQQGWSAETTDIAT